MKLPGAYKNRDKRLFMQQPDILRLDCPACDWTTTAFFTIAEARYRRHLERVHDMPVVAEKKNTA